MSTSDWVLLLVSAAAGYYFVAHMGKTSKSY